VFLAAFHDVSLALSTPSDSIPRTYNYFAYGSNVCTSTMTNLRGIKPLGSSAAILPEHELRFNIPGIPLVEPSWASVEPIADKSKVVHGVLYKLTEADFTAVCKSEGVPLGYVLHRCRPIPYLGDDNCAGQRKAESSDENGVLAYTLRAPKRYRGEESNIPPSRSYMNIIVRGCKENRLDKKYIDYLERFPVGKTLLGNGVAEEMLKRAESKS